MKALVLILQDMYGESITVNIFDSDQDEISMIDSKESAQLSYCDDGSVKKTLTNNTSMSAVDTSKGDMKDLSGGTKIVPMGSLRTASLTKTPTRAQPSSSMTDAPTKIPKRAPPSPLMTAVPIKSSKRAPPLDSLTMAAPTNTPKRTPTRIYTNLEGDEEQSFSMETPEPMSATTCKNKKLEGDEEQLFSMETPVPMSVTTCKNKDVGDYSGRIDWSARVHPKMECNHSSDHLEGLRLKGVKMVSKNACWSLNSNGPDQF